MGTSGAGGGGGLCLGDRLKGGEAPDARCAVRAVLPRTRLGARTDARGVDMVVGAHPRPGRLGVAQRPRQRVAMSVSYISMFHVVACWTWRFGNFSLPPGRLAFQVSGFSLFKFEVLAVGATLVRIRV